VTAPPEEDRLRSLIDLLVESVERPAAGADLARRAYLSRFHFDRLVRGTLRETPAAFRRRLVLERPARRLEIRVRRRDLRSARDGHVRRRGLPCALVRRPPAPDRG